MNSLEISKIVKLSEHFNIDKEAFERSGAYDAILGIDSKVFVDPILLQKTNIYELRNSYNKYEEYFLNIFKDIDNYISLKDNDENKNKAYKKIEESLSFSETSNTFLGFSKKGNNGRGFGRKNAKETLKNAVIFYKCGIKDPTYFELIPVFSKNIGKDKISDIFIKIIIEDLRDYTKRVASENNLNYKDSFLYNKKEIILIPKDILVTEQLALEIKNEEYRKTLNKSMAEIAKYNSVIQGVHSQYTIKDIEQLFDRFKKLKPSKKSYDFINDPDGEFVWVDNSYKIVKEYLIKEESINEKNTVLIKVKEFLNNFKNLVENSSLSIFLYELTLEGQINFKKPRNEKYNQKLIYGISNYYCKFNNINLKAETDSGVGFVNFKSSTGNEIVHIELKIAKSMKILISAYKKQLEENKISQYYGNRVFIIIAFNATQLENIEIFKDYISKIENNKELIEVIYIDANFTKNSGKV